MRKSTKKQQELAMETCKNAVETIDRIAKSVISKSVIAMVNGTKIRIANSLAITVANSFLESPNLRIPIYFSFSCCNVVCK